MGAEPERMIDVEMGSETEFEPPAEVIVNRRWLKPSRVEWAEQADAIIREHGYVSGTVVYPARHHARYQAQKLIQTLDDLSLFERPELREHTHPRQGGWIWTVEYIRR